MRSLALKLCSEFGGPKDEAAFIDAVDRGLEPNRGKGERVWVLDPIDGTKGFMTGQNFVVGLALLDSKGDALIGVMGRRNAAPHRPRRAMAHLVGAGLGSTNRAWCNDSNLSWSALASLACPATAARHS